VDAVEYLDRYLPPPTGPMSFHAQVLRRFLLMHDSFANAVDGIVDKSVPSHYLQIDNGRSVSHAELRLRSISFYILAILEVRYFVISVSARGEDRFVRSHERLYQRNAGPT
jgi:hypothetical protein